VLVEVGALISWSDIFFRIVMLLVPYMWASMTFLPSWKFFPRERPGQKNGREKSLWSEFQLNRNSNSVIETQVKHVTHFRANNYKIFPQNLCHFVHIWAVSLIHSALERNAATIRKVLAPFSLSHVTDSCFLFLSFLIFFFLSLFYNNCSGWILNKKLFYLGLLAGYRIIYHSISSAPS